MPVVSIRGPAGLSSSNRKELITATLRTLVATYRMPDDRVYVEEVAAQSSGHTPLLAVTQGEGWAVGTEAPRIFVQVVAPPGLPLEPKRRLMRELTEHAGRAWGRSDLRDVLVSLDEHKVEDFASNGFLQTENPDMAAFAAALKR